MGLKLILEAHSVVGRSKQESKVYGSNMGPIWGRHDPGGPHVGPMNLAICKGIRFKLPSKVR